MKYIRIIALVLTLSINLIQAYRPELISSEGGNPPVEDEQRHVTGLRRLRPEEETAAQAIIGQAVIGSGPTNQRIITRYSSAGHMDSSKYDYEERMKAKNRESAQQQQCAGGECVTGSLVLQGGEGITSGIFERPLAGQLQYPFQGQAQGIGGNPPTNE